MKVIADIIDEADCHQITLLGLLSMSTAFDTVDYKIFFHWLETDQAL